jgi:hypothetical protein
MRTLTRPLGLLAVWLVSSAPAFAAPPTIDEGFEIYCKQLDSSDWFCRTRASELSDSHKWEIVDAYCFEEVGKARLSDEEARRAAIEALKRSDPGRGDVCAAHDGVKPPMALEFNHRRMEWLGQNKGFEDRKRRIELDPVTRTPTAHLAKGDTVGIVVIDTNPAIVLANRGEAKEDNIDQIKSLEQLLGLLGGAVGGLVNDLARISGDTNAAIKLFKNNALLSKSMPFGSQGDAEVFAQDVASLNGAISSAKASHEPIQQRLKSLVEHRDRLQLVAQDLEDGPATLTGDLDQTLENPVAWHKLFTALASAAKAIPSLERCEAILMGFGPVVSAKPEEAVGLHAAAIQFLELFDINGPSGPELKPPCSESKYVDLLKAAGIAIRDAARTAARNPSDTTLAAALRTAQADARERHLKHTLTLAGLVRQVASIRQGFKETIAKEEETRKAALVLGIVASRVRDAAIRKVKKGETPEWIVTNRIFVQDEVYSSAWSKVRTTPLKIAINSPIADAVPNQRAKETTTSYQFVRRGFDRLTFGVGLVFTPAANIVYTAIDPDPSINQAQTTTTTTGGPAPAPIDTTTVTRPELKVIVEKDRQPRSGTYGTFVNYRFAGSSALGLGGQFGVGLSVDNPAFMGGVSINLSEYVTLGGGVASFRLKRLSQAQSDPAVRVATADEIRTENRWDGYGYFSLSINLSGLPLFK